MILLWCSILGNFHNLSNCIWQQKSGDDRSRYRTVCAFDLDLNCNVLYFPLWGSRPGCLFHLVLPSSNCTVNWLDILVLMCCLSSHNLTSFIISVGLQKTTFSSILDLLANTCWTYCRGIRRYSQGPVPFVMNLTGWFTVVVNTGSVNFTQGGNSGTLYHFFYIYLFLSYHVWHSFDSQVLKPLAGLNEF